jgi:hypothetical protein
MSRNKNVLPVFVASMLLIGAFAYYNYEHSNKLTSITKTSTTQTQQTGTISELADAKCHMKGPLPDSTCTPGAVNPNVTQDNITQTICVKGFTKTIRPTQSYTNRLKAQQMNDYGFTDTIRSHEEDHLISLELGGAPEDSLNLWPEPGASPNAKDSIENHLNAAICAGRISLHEAQVRITTDWTTAENGL